MQFYATFHNPIFFGNDSIKRYFENANSDVIVRILKILVAVLIFVRMIAKCSKIINRRAHELLERAEILRNCYFLRRISCFKFTDFIIPFFVIILFWTEIRKSHRRG